MKFFDKITVSKKNKKILKKGLTNRILFGIMYKSSRANADMAQSVEHVIGNDEVISSNLIISSKIHRNSGGFFVVK